MTATEAEDEACTICGHPLDPHIMLALDPLKGGVGRCPEDGCECRFTWGPDGVVPSQDVQDLLDGMWENDRLRFTGYVRGV